MNSCLFCSIAAGDTPATVVYSDDRFVAFRDLNPQAPTHILVIPRDHFADTEEISATNPTLAGELLAAAATVADVEGLADGYRVVLNTGRDGGQTVDHVHVHVLGGRHLGWPPG